MSACNSSEQDEAYELGKAGLSLLKPTAEMWAEMGDVEFRRAQMRAAEENYINALKVDPRESRALLGLSRLYRAYSMNRTAYDVLKAAHEIAPGDPEVQREWLQMLPRKETSAID